MLSKRQVLLKHYRTLFAYAQANFPGVFPDPEDIDAEDIVLFIVQFFTPHYATGDYSKVIHEITKLRGLILKEAEFETHYLAVQPTIHEYLLG